MLHRLGPGDAWRTRDPDRRPDGAHARVIGLGEASGGMNVANDIGDELVLERAPRGFLPRQTLARHAIIAGGGAVVLAGITMMLAPFPNYKVAAIAYTVIAVAGL